MRQAQSGYSAAEENAPRRRPALLERAIPGARLLPHFCRVCSRNRLLQSPIAALVCMSFVWVRHSVLSRWDFYFSVLLFSVLLFSVLSVSALSSALRNSLFQFYPIQFYSLQFPPSALEELTRFFRFPSLQPDASIFAGVEAPKPLCVLTFSCVCALRWITAIVIRTNCQKRPKPFWKFLKVLLLFQSETSFLVAAVSTRRRRLNCLLENFTQSASWATDSTDRSCNEFRVINFFYQMWFSCSMVIYLLEAIWKKNLLSKLKAMYQVFLDLVNRDCWVHQAASLLKQLYENLKQKLEFQEKKCVPQLEQLFRSFLEWLQRVEDSSAKNCNSQLRISKVSNCPKFDDLMRSGGIGKVWRFELYSQKSVSTADSN